MSGMHKHGKQEEGARIPANRKSRPGTGGSTILDSAGFDKRRIRLKRPTILDMERFRFVEADQIL